MHSVIEHLLRYTSIPVCCLSLKTLFISRCNESFAARFPEAIPVYNAPQETQFPASNLFDEPEIARIVAQHDRFSPEKPLLPWESIIYRHNEGVLTILFHVVYAFDDTVVVAFASPEGDAHSSHSVFGAVLESFPGVVMLISPTGRVLTVNNATVDYLDRSREEILGRGMDEIGMPELARRVQHFFGVIKDASSIWKQEFREILKGRPRHFAGTLRPVFSDQHTLHGVLAVIEDCTAAHEAADSLALRDRLMQSTGQTGHLLLSDKGNFETTLKFFLRELGEAIGASRASVWGLRPDENSLEPSSGAVHMVMPIYAWCANGVVPFDEDFFKGKPIESLLPGWKRHLEKGHSVCGPVTDFPDRTQEILSRLKVKTILASPILLGGRLWGFIAYDDSVKPRLWTSVEKNILRTAGTVLGSAIDSRMMQDKLRASDERLRDIVEASGEVVWALDSSMCFTYVSERMMDILGYAPDELLGKPWACLHEGLAGQFTFERGKTYFREIMHTVRHKNGTPLQLRSSGKLFWSPSGALLKIHGNSVDVTATWESEERLRVATDEREFANKQLAEAVAAANKLAAEAQIASAAKSEFLANMSHEIRTPMNAVLGMLHIVLQSSLTESQHAHLAKAEMAAKSLLRILNDILDFSKIEAGKMDMETVSFRLDESLHQVTDLMADKVKAKGITLEAVVHPDTPVFLQGDPLRLNQVLLNLVSNAVKFTESGRVVIGVSPEKFEEADRVTLIFTVKDSGIGMTSQQVTRLFSPFSQADTSTTRRYGGTGLGLALSKSIVGLMGGTISCSSAVAQGSEFRFSARFGISAERQKKEAVPTRLMSQLKVLAVDDNDASLSIMHDLLSGLGCKNIVRACSGEEALEAVEQAGHSPFDCMVSDWKMPGLDGLEALREMRRRKLAGTPEIVVFSTAYDRAELRHISRSDNVQGIVSKPLTQSLLYNALLEAFDGGLQFALPKELLENETGEIHGVRVLLVEDNELNQVVAQELLQASGAVVETASNGKECLELLETTEFDIVLMDIQMPVMDGLTAARLIRQDGRFETLPIVAMTAHAMVGDKEKSLRAGMNDHVTKPIVPEELRVAIGRWCNANKPGAVRKRSAENQHEQPGPAMQPALPDSLPGINIAEGLEKTGTDFATYKKMLLKLRETMPVQLKQLREAALHGDLSRAERLARTLHEASATIGATDVRESSKRVGKQLKNRTLDENSLSDLTASVRVLLASLHTL